MKNAIDQFRRKGKENRTRGDGTVDFCAELRVLGWHARGTWTGAAVAHGQCTALAGPSEMRSLGAASS